MQPRSFPSFTILLGCGLVLALVAALPVALALLPAETLHTQLGPGDCSAAALSSLDRDIQSHRVPTPESRHVVPVFLFLRVPVGEDHAADARGRATARDPRHPPLPGTCTPGPTEAGHLLRL